MPEVAAHLGYADSDETSRAKIVNAKLTEARVACAKILARHEMVKTVLSTNHRSGGTDYYVRLVEDDARSDVQAFIREHIPGIIWCEVTRSVGGDRTHRVAIDIDDQAAADYTEGERGVCIPLTALTLATLLGAFIVSVRMSNF